MSFADDYFDLNGDGELDDMETLLKEDFLDQEIIEEEASKRKAMSVAYDEGFDLDSDSDFYYDDFDFNF